jgi:cation-transporting P-type ATPase 13A2
MAHYVC